MEGKIERVLGKGAMGVVYLMNFKSPNQQRKQLAVKSMESSEGLLEDRMLGEMKIMRKLNHKHIVKYYIGYQHKDKILLLLEYCPGTDLHRYLQTRRPSQYLTEPEVYKFASQIASAIGYLHQNHIIHRDIKPQNILLTKNNHVKLTDFGISSQLENTMAQAITYIGTPLYTAPEILNHEQYSYKADSWSFGCCLHELMSLQYAFKHDGEDNSQIKPKILSAKFHPIPRRYNINLIDLVKSLLVVDVDKRFKMSDTFSFLQGMREDSPDILTPAPEIPILPDKKAVMSAIRRYTIEINQSSDSEDPENEVQESEYSEDFESDSESDEQTALSKTVYEADLDTMTPPQKKLRQSQKYDFNSTASSVISSDDALTGTSDTFGASATSSDYALTGISGTLSASSVYSDAGSFQDADSYVKEVSGNLRKKLVCLNVDDDNTSLDSGNSKIPSDLDSSGHGKKKKKKSFLKEKRKSIDVEDQVTKEPITLYTRSQKVIYTKQDSTENKPTVFQQFREEVGNEKYLQVVSLKNIIKDPKLLEHQLIDIIGSTLYKRYRNLFLDSKSW